MHRALAALLAGTALFKLVYVFALTDYRHYLFSDFWAYWFRALQRLAGNQLGSAQWAIWPPLPHILLSWYLQVVDLVGLTAWRLEAVLVANVVMSTASVALVYGIALQTLKSARWAFGVAGLYALAFPLVFFNAFVMSEHPATLCLLAALWLVLRSPREIPALAGAGVLLGLATALRPAFVPPAAAFFVYLAAAARFGRRERAVAAAFAIGFAVVVGAAVLETSRISGGIVTGLGANGGLSFYFSQCRTRQLIARYNGEDYAFVLPALSDRPENGTVYVDRPIHDQGFFWRLGWDCLREQPDPLAGMLERFRNLFFGPLLPTAPSAWGFESLLPPSRWFMLLCSLLAPLALFIRPASGVRLDAVALLGGIVALAAAGLCVFSAEHRYLYPLAGPLLVLCAAILLAAWREPRRMAIAGAAWVLALGVLTLGTLATQALRWRGLDPAIAIEIRRFASPYVVSGIEPVVQKATVRRLYYPEGDRLWRPRPGEDDTFATHRTCMEVRAAGLYELQVVAGVGFILRVDGRTLISNRFARLDEAYKWRLELPAGKHAYEIRMDRPFGVTATWRRVTSHSSDFAPALHMRYVGEPDEDAVFLPPERC